ncbi:MAG: YihY/virulence factor BrkB family protein [Bacteroidales bacterium]|nr:YihY/virulence factor BrkB family protein [Bacteroidales bacterium]MCK9498012.1 YihY/virulence factor BrkB family protein [Bacteroidales bacterium]MDY0314220.1 YihY/virulence factor BrkB family protein [Bacteroidales bacterium]NLB85478.1 YihY/virulence factor BrkB family protein [Bacteroidales bacterium]
MKNKIKALYIKFLLILKRIGDKIILPGFRGLSLYYIGKFFFQGIRKSSVTMRAAAVSFNMFISLFPALIFLFTLIPFIPISGFQTELFNILDNLLPNSAYELFYETITDTIMKQNTKLLSLSILLMIYFSSNGIMALIEAFNNTFHNIETRNSFSLRIVSLIAVLGISLLILFAISLIVMGNSFILKFVSTHPAIVTLTRFVKWLVILILYFLAISLLFYFAPSKKNRFSFISPGTIFSTFLQVITVLGFTYYVNNFAMYNKLYGSIGTVIIVMLLIYISSLSLILGFELNASILHGDKSVKEKK